MTEAKLREQLRKIFALYEGATTPGERSAAAAAIERIKKAIAALSQTEPLVEYQFKLSDVWQQRLFSALCRRYGLAPYRYKRQRKTTMVIKAPKTFVTRTLWPEYQRLRGLLDRYLTDVTDRLILEEVLQSEARRRSR